MKLLFRVDASRQIGGGHVMRCLTLAHAAKARGHVPIFVSRALKGNMNALIAESFPLRELPAPKSPKVAQKGGPPHAHWLEVPWQEDAAQTVLILQTEQPDWLIVDHYALDAAWTKAVAPKRLFLIDDLADRPLTADLLLDQTRITPSQYPQGVRRLLSGPKYTLLRPEFSAPPPARKPASPPRILIAPGLMDSYDLTSLALDALSDLDVEIDLATGPAAPALPKLSQNTPHNLTLHTPADDMAALINTATLAIAAGGMSAWERCALGLPSIIVSVAENQRHVCEGLAAEGACLHIDGTPRPSAKSLREACLSLLQSDATRREMSQKALQMCDGKGTDRVLDVLEAELRGLRPNDENLILNWRNQPDIRQASLNSTPLTANDHAKWFAKALIREDAIYRIYREGARDLGFVNAQQNEGHWHWSFYIGAQNAPKGAGRRMLVSFLDLFFAKTTAKALNATVLESNHASLRLHQTLGFTQAPSPATSELTFTLLRQDWERSKSP